VWCELNFFCLSREIAIFRFSDLYVIGLYVAMLCAFFHVLSLDECVNSNSQTPSECPMSLNSLTVAFNPMRPCVTL
jgi:hypothetical protein